MILMAKQKRYPHIHGKCITIALDSENEKYQLGKEEKPMMDMLMLTIFAASFGLLYLLIRWCKAQMDQENQGGNTI